MKLQTETVHTTTIVGKCPHGCDDVYTAEFHVGNLFVSVESIAKIIAEIVGQPIYQELLTQELANRVGCKVKTRGMHGRFSTDCTATPGPCE
jgi:hypothetical protein